MSRTTLKILVLIALGALVIAEIAGIVTAVFSQVWGIATSVVIAGITIFCTRMASGDTGMKGWYLFPTVLFVVVPTLYKLLRILMTPTSRFDMLAALTPLLFGFLLPAGILLYISWRLWREERKEAAAAQAITILPPAA